MFLFLQILAIVMIVSGGVFLTVAPNLNLTIEHGFLISAVLLFAGFLTAIASILYASLPRKNVKKHRTSFPVQCNCSQERVQFAVDVFMREKGYTILKYNDEEVYRKGNGWWAARRFIKCNFNEDNTVVIEGWISPGMGSAASIEMNLDGFYGFVPKKMVKDDIAILQTRIGNLAD